jgi:hypothetical protein
MRTERYKTAALVITAIICLISLFALLTPSRQEIQQLRADHEQKWFVYFTNEEVKP